MKNILLTGQSGLNKSQFIKELKNSMTQKTIECSSIGQTMISKHPHNSSINEQNILNLPKSELDLLRRYSWEIILKERDSFTSADYFILDTHAVFRWHHGMFPTLELDQVLEFNPDYVFCLIDDILSIKRGLLDRGTDILAFWELFAWREEEISTSQIIAQSCSKLLKKQIPFFIIPKSQGAILLSNLLLNPSLPKIYLSFPITGKESDSEVEYFKQEIKNNFISFDPYSVKDRAIKVMYYTLENEIIEESRSILEEIKKTEANNNSKKWGFISDELTPIQLIYFNEIINSYKLLGRDVSSVLEAIDSQIISRDYLLIDQSDFIVVYIKDNNGQPFISAGCQSEVVYAFSTGKKVYVIYSGGERKLSPWVTQYSKIFTDLNDCLQYLIKTYKK